MASVHLGEMTFFKIKDKHVCEYSSKRGDFQGGKIIKMSTFKSQRMFLLYHIVITMSIYSTNMFSFLLWDL